MKFSLFKKIVLALVGALAFSTGAFAYTAGQIEGTTGAGTVNDPVKVNTFAEFKAAMENNEIEYVELGDVDGEDGYVIPSSGEASVDVNGVKYHPQGIVVRTPKKLNLAGKASFTQTAKAYGFILVGSEVEIYGNGSITYLILTGGDYYANAVFNVAPNGFLYVKSGTIEAKNHPTFGSGLYCYAIRANSKNTLVIIDGGVFKGENAEGSVEVGNGNGVIRGGRFEDSRINYGGYVSAYNGVTCVTGGTFSSFCSTIYVPEKSIIKNSAGNELSRRECFSEEISVESPVRHLLNLKSTDGGSARIIAPAETYGDGERIFLKAAADDGYVFTGWKSKDVILSEERDFVLTIYDDMNVEATFARPEDIDIVNGEIYTVRLRCSTPEAQSIEVCESATKGVSVTSTSLMEIVENGNSRTVEKFGEYGFYKVTTVVSIDDGLDLKFTENPRIVYDNEVLGNVQFKGSKYVNSFINTRLNMYKVTFLDTDGKTVLSENWLQKGTVPTEIPLTITLPAENDEYVFLNGGWTPEVSANTEDVVYEARIDSIMKDLNAYITVKYKYGGEVTVETNSKCVDIEKQFLGLGEKTFRYSTNKWSDGTEGLSLTEGTYDFAFRVKIILDQCNDMYARSLRYFGTKKVYYFLDGSFVDGTWLYVGENASNTTGSNISYSFTVVSSYAVTFFDDKGVQVGDVVTVVSGMAVSTPAEPAKREGYTFAGWFMKDAETAYDFSAAVNGDLELYEKWTVNQYSIAFVDEDGKTVLKTATEYEYGTAAADITLPTETPTKAADAQYTYIFAGWSPEVDDVKGDAIYTATYSKVLNSYAVTFVDEDGKTVLKVATDYEYGTAAADITLPTETPTKAADAQYTYTFAGWSPEVADVKGDAIYTATYSKVLNSYAVTFVDEDGKTVLKVASDYEYGTAAADITLPTETPTKAADAQYTYTFAGWSPEVADVKGDAIYTATYSKVLNSYAVTFVDEDGKTILKAATDYEYGTAAADIALPTETPTKAADAQYTYTFAGWSPEVADVKGDAIYTATYSKVLNMYTVTFLDFDETKLDEQSVEYGGGATAPSEPSREGYEFTGWDKAFDNIIENLTVNALYEELPASGSNDPASSSSAEVSSSSVAPASSSSVPASSSSVVASSSSIAPASSSSVPASSSSVVASSSSIAPASSSSVPASSSSVVVSSSSVAPASSSSVPASSSSVVVSSSSVAPASSSSTPASSSSKTEVIYAATQIPQFSATVVGRSIQIAGAHAGSAYAILDMQGRVLVTGRAAANFAVEIPRAGSYMVRVASQMQRVNVK